MEQVTLFILTSDILLTDHSKIFSFEGDPYYTNATDLFLGIPGHVIIVDQIEVEPSFLQFVKPMISQDKLAEFEKIRDTIIRGFWFLDFKERRMLACFGGSEFFVKNHVRSKRVVEIETDKIKQHLTSVMHQYLMDFLSMQEEE